MRILGIDTSLTGTGLALVDLDTYEVNRVRQGGIPDGGTIPYTAQTVTVCAPGPTKDKSKRAMARRVRALIDQIEDCFRDTEERPDHVGMEGLAYSAGNASAWVLAWIWGEVIALCEKYDVPLTIVATTARAKFATGKGNAPKEQVLLTAVKLMPDADISDNNEGDAAIIAAAVCQQLGFPILPVTVARTEVMAKLGD